MQQAAGATNTTLAQTAAALAGVEAQGAKLTTTLRQAGSSQEIVRTLNEMAASGQAAAGQVAPLIAQLQRLEGEGSRAALSMRQVDGEIKSMSVSVRQASTTVTPWVQAVNQLAGVIPGLSRAVNAYSAATLASAQANAQAAASTGAAGTAATGLSAALGPVIIVAAAAAAAVAGTAAALKASVQEFAAYQSAILKVQALTGATAEDTARFAARIRELAREGPISAKELGDGLYYISSSGFKGAEALQVLEATNKAAAAGFGSFTNIADATTSVLKAYGLSAGQAAQVTDVLAATVIEGKVEADQFAQSIGAVLPVAANLGVSVEQVGAAIATMTNRGLNAFEAVTALRQVFNQLLGPSEQAEKQLAAVGLTAAELQAILRDPTPGQGLPAALALIQERTGGNLQMLNEIIPEIRGMVGYLALAGVASEEYAAILDKTTHAQGRVAEAQQITSTGYEYQAKVFHRSMEELGLAVGSVAVPHLTSLIQHASTGIKHLEDMATSVSQLAGRLPALGAAFSVVGQGLLSGLLPQLQLVKGLIDQIGGWTAPPDTGRTGEGTRGLREGTQAPTSTVPNLPPPPPPTQLLTPDEMRANAQAMATVSSEADKMHATMVQLFHLPADANPTVINKQLQDLYSAEAKQEEQWSKAFDPSRPQEAANRIRTLQGLVDSYTQAVLAGDKAAQGAAQTAIDSYINQEAAASRATEQAKKIADFQRQQENEAKRRAHEAAEADPLLGISQAMEKDRESLMGTAGKVMADLQNAVALQGQAGARAAGAAFANEARSWGEELQKAGVPGWQDAFNQLMAMGEVAVVTKSPEIIQAIHALLEQMDSEVKESRVAKSMREAFDRAQEQIVEGGNKFNLQMAQADASAADSRLSALQSNLDREYDAWAKHQIDIEMREEQHGMELSRIKERWAAEDRDRGQQRLRAEQDRAEMAARSFRDMALGQTRSREDAQRQLERSQQQAAQEHNRRLQEIQQRGGPDMAKAVAEENRSYSQQQQRSADDATYQAAERQLQETRQIEDANRRIADQKADAARKDREATADLEKQRTRQLADRTQQQQDQDILAAHRLDKERLYHIDAQSKAEQRLKDDMARTDAKWAHELAKAMEALDLIRAKTEHDQAVTEIKAREREGLLSEEEARGQLNEENRRYASEAAGIAAQGQQTAVGIDERLRQQVAANAAANRAPGFTPQSPMIPTTTRAADQRPGAAIPAQPTGDNYNLYFNFTLGTVVGTNGMQELSQQVLEVAKRELRGTVLLAGARGLR